MCGQGVVHPDIKPPAKLSVHWYGGSVKSVAHIELSDFVCARAGGPGGSGTKAERMELGSHVISCHV